MRGVEVIDLEEKADAPGNLVSDRRRLTLPVRLGEQDRGVAAGWADDHPPLRPAVVGQRRRVLDQVKSESAGEEGNGLVVVVNDDRNLVEPHAGERTTVWAALTTAEGLNAWFGYEATIDLRPGGSAQMPWPSGDTADMRIERVEGPTVFGYTWHLYGLPDDDPRRTYVEFTLEPTAAGTRLTVVEAGFAQLPDEAYHKAFDGNTQGWASEFGELAEYLDAA